MRMRVKEHILTIRLMEKLQACPECARELGIEATNAHPATDSDKKGE